MSTGIRRPLRSHGRYPYSAITERADYCWPGGSRLAFYVALNLEHYAFGEGLTEQLVPGSPEPDVANWSWREYGNRVGAWRLLELFQDLSLPVALLVNTDCYSHCPQLVAAYRRHGAEIAGHGRTNSETQNGLDEAAERALIGEATAAIAHHEGSPPAGWLGPWIAETAQTPELLAEAGYRYVLDWCADDQPLWLSTRKGPLVAVPYPQEINDSSAIVGRRAGAEEFAAMIVDQVDEMRRQSRRQPLVMGVALHAYVTGQPFRLGHLRRALEHVAAMREHLWVATPGEIERAFRARVHPPVGS